MSKHTPGPWHSTGKVWSGNQPAGIFSGRQTEGGGWVDSKQVWPPYACDPQSEDYQRHVADLRLIAAAPDLLQALWDCMTKEGAVARKDADPQKLVRRLNAIDDICRAAIAKAEGRD